MSLMDSHPSLKPMNYPWAYEAWLLQQRLHWLPEEVPMADDVKDWNVRLTPSQKNLLTQIFRFFVTADIDVGRCYNKHYSKVFQPTEVQMMLTAFSNMETVHVAAYSHLLDTVGMPDSEHLKFLEYKAMKDKHEASMTYNVSSKKEIAKTLAAFGAFTEGVQLFASFSILLNFPRQNLMKGMGQIISWSVRDESLHCENIIKLFHTFIQENPRIWNDELKREIYEIAERTVEHEDAFIDLAFEMGGVDGLEAKEVKRYIRYLADRRLLQLGLKNIFKVKKNPLPWVDTMTAAVEHTNFFENRATAYSKAATRGTWEEAFSS